MISQIIRLTEQGWGCTKPFKPIEPVKEYG